MNRVSVASSNIASIGYDGTMLVLEIEFSSGSVYQYLDVPQQVFEALMSAVSKGQFFATSIKGSYRYVRV